MTISLLALISLLTFVGAVSYTVGAVIGGSFIDEE